MNNRDLATIVGRVQKNKDKHFETLFNEIYQTIYYISYKLLESKTEADDASQDIIIYIYNHIEDLKAPEGFNKWMNRIIYGACANRKKRWVNQKEYLKGDEYIESQEKRLVVGPEQLFQTKEKSEIVLGIIDGLPLKQKEVLLLYYYQEMTAKEISEVLSCSLASVQNSLFKAKRSIRLKVERSDDLQTYQLYSISGMTIIVKMIAEEIRIISWSPIKKQMWTSILKFSDTKDMENVNQKVSSGEIKQTSTFMFTIGIGLFLIIAASSAAAYMLNTADFNTAQTERESTTEVLKNSDFNFNTIHKYSGNDNLFESEGVTSRPTNPEAKENEIVVGGEETESVYNPTVTRPSEALGQSSGDQNLASPSVEIVISPPNNIAAGSFESRIWDKNSDRDRVTNTAQLEDEGKKDLSYSEVAGDWEESGAVYQEEDYKITSGMTYHDVELPRIEYVKTGSEPNGSTLFLDDIITYEITATNIGRVPAEYIILQDFVPDNTSLLPGSAKSNQVDTKILNYQVNEHGNQNLNSGVATDQPNNTTSVEVVTWIISGLEPGEKVTVSFQVKIAVNKRIPEETTFIHNTAMIKVLNDNTNIDQEVLNENGFDSSNEVIYQLINSKRGSNHDTNEPVTGDSISLIWLIALSASSFLILIYLRSTSK